MELALSLTMASVLHSIKEITSFITVIFVLIILSIILGYMVFSIVYVVPYLNDVNFQIPIYIVLPFPMLVAWLKSGIAYGWYIFLAITVSISAVLIAAYGIIPYFKSFFSKPFAYRRNPFQEMSELYAVNIFFSMLVVYLMYLFGFVPSIPPGLEEMPVWAQMLSFLHASVYEELIVRTVFLGVPVFLIYILQGKKISILRIFGGYNKITKVEAIFIIISAAIFAAAHVPAWDMWKAIPTFVGGLILGYLYIRYGIYASIMLHFLTDFISIPMAMHKEYQFIIGMLMIILAIAGTLFFISYTIRFINYFSGKKKKEVKKKVERKEYIPSWTNLVCPNCGGRVFQYVDENTVRCVNCGTLIKIKKDDERDDST